MDYQFFGNYLLINYFDSLIKSGIKSGLVKEFNQEKNQNLAWSFGFFLAEKTSR